MTSRTPSFTDEEKGRIRDAVASAERQTAGEIVPFVVDKSGDYEVAYWRAAVLFAVAALLVIVVAASLHRGWGLAFLHRPDGVAALALAAGAIGAALVALVPAVRRWLAGDDTIALTVHRRAMQAFVEEEVFSTANRTGILIFVSLMEHRIEVIGDAGIHQAVKPEEWADVVEVIRAGIKRGAVTDGLVEAIGICGRLLEKKGVGLPADDQNELPDDLRLR